MSIPFSILDLATVCEGDSYQTTFKKSLESAKHAEALGYTRYWFSEHHSMASVASAATSLLIGYVAGGTTSIRVGSGGIMLPNHSPLIIAEQFGTLAEIYPGRIDLGLGRAPGTDAATAQAIRGTHPAAPYDFGANIALLRQYMSPDNAGAKVRAIPGEGAEVPFWILGSSTDSAHLAASLGLPYAFAGHFAPAQMMTAFHIYKNNFKASAQLDKPYYMACVNVIAADSMQEAKNIATSLYRIFLAIITDKRQPLQPPVSSEVMKTLWTPEQEAYVKQMLALSFIGDSAYLRENLDYFIRETGIHEIMITSPIFDLQSKHNSQELFSKVMKSF